MGKSLGYVTIAINGMNKQPVIIKVGGKNVEDVVEALQNALKSGVTKSEMNTALAGKVNTYEANDIEALSTTMLNKLKAGDVVIKKSGSERHAYRVAYKDDTKHECALVYCDAWNVEELYYDKSVGNAWSLIEKKVTAIATPSNEE